MRRVGIGVIGCGVIGKRHLEAAASPANGEQLRVAAVCDVREELAQAAQAQYGAGKAYADADALLADPAVDAVVLAMPTGARGAVARRALEAGKHVLLEKPPAMSVRELDDLAAVRGDRVVACCSSRMQFYPSADVARDFVAGGALGQIRVVRCRALTGAGKAPTKPPPVWRLNRALNGGGILVNWGVYDLDYLMALTGWRLKPRTVLAQTWPISPTLLARAAAGSDAETHVTALIRCAGGEVISIERAEFVPSPTDEAWQILGDRGALRLRMIPCKKTIHHDAADAETGFTTRVLWEGEEEGGTQHAGPVTDFAAAILNGHEPKTSLARARVLQQIFDAVYESAAAGRCVEIGSET
jgi:predicted dehydrogenase